MKANCPVSKHLKVIKGTYFFYCLTSIVMLISMATLYIVCCNSFDSPNNYVMSNVYIWLAVAIVPFLMYIIIFIIRCKYRSLTEIAYMSFISLTLLMIMIIASFLLYALPPLANIGNSLFSQVVEKQKPNGAVYYVKEWFTSTWVFLFSGIIVFLLSFILIVRSFIRIEKL